MSGLEDELRKSMRRENPGPEFTRKVMEQVAGKKRRSWWEAVFQAPRLRWAMAGVMAGTLLIFGGIEHRREQRVRAEGEAAKEQLVLALRIAGGKLHATQAKVVRY
jgi:hypothetical protein